MNGYQAIKRRRQMARTFFKNISNYGKVVPKGIKKTYSMLIATEEENPLYCGCDDIATLRRFNRGIVYELAKQNCCRGPGDDFC
jgi:hypothetical protein